MISQHLVDSKGQIAMTSKHPLLQAMHEDVLYLVARVPGNSEIARASFSRRRTACVLSVTKPTLSLIALVCKPADACQSRYRSKRSSPRARRCGMPRQPASPSVSVPCGESCASLAEISIIFGLNYKPELWIYNPNAKDRVQE